MATLVFRSSFRVLWRWTNTFTGTVGLIVYLTSLDSGAPVPFGLSALMAVALGTVFAIAIVLFPVYVRADGIRCYGYCGIYCTLRWEEVARARVEGVMGLPYLVASSASGWREVWIPLYLSDMPKFVQAIRACVSPDHPLAAVLDG